MAQQSLSFSNMSEILEANTIQQVVICPPPNNIPSNIWKDAHTFTSNVASDPISVISTSFVYKSSEFFTDLNSCL